MSKADTIFIKNIRQILTEGISDEFSGGPMRDSRPPAQWEDGTPAHTIKCFGIVNRYNLKEEFPVLTLRKQFFKSALDELLWIWQKKSNNVHELSSHIWDQWADEDGSIGKAYGYQLGVKYKTAASLLKAKELFGENHVLTVPSYAASVDAIAASEDVIHAVAAEDEGVVYMDQVDKVIYDLRYNPTSRRTITNIFNPADLMDMKLEPCAYSMTFNVSGNTLNAILNQRSQDMLTANGWNVMQYSALLVMMAQISGLEAGELVHVIADCHVYDRHIPVVKELIEREPLPAPSLEVDTTITDFYAFTKDSLKLIGYQGHALDASLIPVAV